MSEPAKSGGDLFIVDNSESDWKGLNYRSRHAEFLKIDFPRLPLTGNLALFCALARLGGELTALHLLESPLLLRSADHQSAVSPTGSRQGVASIGPVAKWFFAVFGGMKASGRRVFSRRELGT